MLIFLACCLVYGGTVGVLLNSRGIFHQPVCRTLGCSLGSLTVYQACYGLAAVAMLPFVNRLLERWNVRAVFGAAAAILGISTICMAGFHSVWQWYAAGTLQGLAGAFLEFMLLPYFIPRWFARRRGIVFGLAAVFSGITGILANMAGGLLIENAGWRTAYVVLGCGCLAMALPGTLLLQRAPEEIGQRAYGTADGTPVEPVCVQPAQQERGLAASLFGIAGIWALCTGYFQHTASFAETVGASTLYAATTASVGMAGNIAGKLGLGLLNERWPETRVSVLGTAILAGAFVCLLCCYAWPELLPLGAFLLGFSYSMVSVQLPQLVSAYTSPERYRVLFPRISIANALMSTVGSSAIGILYSAANTYFGGFLIMLTLLGGAELLQWQLQKNKL